MQPESETANNAVKTIFLNIFNCFIQKVTESVAAVRSWPIAACCGLHLSTLDSTGEPLSICVTHVRRFASIAYPNSPVHAPLRGPQQWSG
jgi:hypothetical protein